MHKVGALTDVQRPQVEVTPLFQDEQETVRMEVWAPNASIKLDTSGGAELLVLDGGFTESGEQLEKHSWLRLPINAECNVKTGLAGARVWIKTKHLRSVHAPTI